MDNFENSVTNLPFDQEQPIFRFRRPMLEQIHCLQDESGDRPMGTGLVCGEKDFV